MTRSWLNPFSSQPAAEVPSPAAPADAAPFSLNRLAQENPGLARHYLWGTNPAPSAAAPLWLHLGCGANVLDGFVNLDFLPGDERVLGWNLLDLWPEEMNATVEGAFSEDTLEHFFFGEQAYILCNLNRALKMGAVARTLMPSLARLVEFSNDYRLTPDEFLHRTYGVETGADALNVGMRFSGHRWLHNAQSLARLAAQCGFVAVPTDCTTSTVAKLSGLNIRNEADSLSFATDLRKSREVTRLMLVPQAIAGAQAVEEIAAGATLYQATTPRPVVEYALPRSVAAEAVACINFRSSNLSSFAAHNLKTLLIDGNGKPWNFDETLKSRSCMNLVTPSELKLALDGRSQLSTLRFSPAALAGEYFSLGCAELFLLK
jgi:hypothetical protein